MKIFCERLKELREEKDWSLRVLAKKLNVSDVAISRWERGIQTPNIDYLKDIAIIFNVTTDYLVGLED